MVGSVYCAVRTDSLYKADYFSSLKGCCHGKVLSVTCSECESAALIIQHALRMRLLYSHLWPARLYHVFPHYVIKCTIFGRELVGHTICVLISLQILSENVLISRIIQRDIIVNIYYPLFLSDFIET